SVNTVLSDPLPPQVTYVPGSLVITQGPNAGAKTDATGDDQGEYVVGTNTVVFRLGVGANGAMGGTLAPSASSTVTFQVKVNPNAMGTISNQGNITASGQLGAPSNTDVTGDGSVPGTPTVTNIDQCATDADCSVPTPHCDVAPSPHVCVECLVDPDCPMN